MLNHQHDMFAIDGMRYACHNVGVGLERISIIYQIELLKETIASDDPTQRRKAGTILGKIDTHEARNAIVEVLIDDDPERQQRAIDALGGGQESQIIRSVVVALEKLGTRQATGALSLCVTASSVRVQREALEFLEHCHSLQATEALLQALESGNPTIRFQVVMSLARHSDLRAAHGILKALGDQEYGVKSAAVRVLQKDDRPEVLVALVRLALWGHDCNVRRNAKLALQRYWTPPMIQGLFVALKREGNSIEPSIVALLKRPQAARQEEFGTQVGTAG